LVRALTLSHKIDHEKTKTIRTNVKLPHQTTTTTNNMKLNTHLLLTVVIINCTSFLRCVESARLFGTKFGAKRITERVARKKIQKESEETNAKEVAKHNDSSKREKTTFTKTRIKKESVGRDAARHVDMEHAHAEWQFFDSMEWDRAESDYSTLIHS